MSVKTVVLVNAICESCGDEGKVYWIGHFAEEPCFACGAKPIYLTKVGA